MDLSKTFEKFSHIYSCLLKYGFSANSLKLLQNYCSDQFQPSRRYGSFSNWAELSAGVPLGFTLGPLLFNISV